MKINHLINEDHQKLQINLIQREKQERQAIATITSDTLTKLNISIDALPHKCQQLLHQAATTLASMDIEQLDPIAISLLQSRELSEKLEDEYEILKLRQKNEELQAKIDRNTKFLEDLTKELQISKDWLTVQTPNPDNIQDYIRQLKQKIASYEESCEKAKAKFCKLSVPERVMPKSLWALVTSLESLQAEAATLRQRADDVALARDARETFRKLRR